jgi:hypothetical protein
MRQSIFLLPIIFAVACGCGKNSAGQTTGGESNRPPGQAPAPSLIQPSNQTSTSPSHETDEQMLERIDREASNQVAAEEKLLLPATNRPDVDVDIVIQNSSTNDYGFSFKSGLDIDISPTMLNSGQRQTNANVMWANWSRIEMLLGNLQTGVASFPNVPLTDVNDQLASGKYHRVLFQILDPGEVKVTCK